MSAAPQAVHVLLVDDLDENLLALEMLLRREGLVLLKARSGVEALELLLANDIALALVDVQMPGMDGFELAELMRGTERTKNVPIIFLTAGAVDQQRRFRGYETGAVDFLYKPIEPHVLKSKVDVFFELGRRRQEVAHLLQEAQLYAQALEDADKRKNEFLAMLAHELRNPLAPIRNGLQILKGDVSTEKSADVRGIMERQLSHMVRLIDDLLDMSRVSQGKIELRRATITMQEVVRNAIETAMPFIEARKHNFTVAMSEETVTINADLTRLAQVIANLVNNAAKYTPEGGDIHLSAHAEGDMAVISVSDNGVGLPPDMVGKVFDLFTQVESSMSRAEGGLGIGLALVKHLAEMHDGSVDAHSAGRGKGSTFTVRIPIDSTAIVEQDDAQHAQDEGEMKPFRILVVDDNVPSAQTTGWMLEAIGHEATLAHEGNQAIDIARKMLPDIMLLDIGLPGKDGYEICRELRRDPAFKNTVFIAQTGWGQKRDRDMAFDAGFDYHLTKPVSLPEFNKLLGSLRKVS